MEDKIKQVFDNLNEEETDNLIKDSYVLESSLNEDRIKNMVLEKTGLKKRRNTLRRRIIYIAASAAACTLIIIGVYALMPDDSSNGRWHKDGIVADKDDKDKDGNEFDADKITDSEKGADESTNNEPVKIQAGDEDNGSSDSDKKTGKKHDTDKKNPNKGAKMELGDYGKLMTLSSDEIEELFDDYANEIDMDAFKAEYDTLEDMINDSDFIVRGKKVSSSLKVLDEDYMYSLTAKFEVDTILVDKTGKDIPDKINVNESILVDEKRECYTYVGGYNYMKVGNEYILFLKKAKKGYYNIAGSVYGKVPLNPDEEVMYIDSGYTQEQDLKNLYKIINYGREKYIEESYEEGEPPKPSPQAIITASPVPEKTAAPSVTQTPGL